MLGNNEVALVPHNPSPTPELISLFDHFDSLPTNTMYLSLLNRYSESNDEKFEFALDTIKHYKGMFDHFDTNIEFDIYQKIKPWLSEGAIKRFQQYYFREYALAILNNKMFVLEADLINIILDNDLGLYMQIAKKMNIPDAVRKIFNKNPFAVYEWLNNCENPYPELIKLNEPLFILQNMNGRLSISDGSLKYIIEFTEPNRDLFLSIKRNVGLKKFFELAGDNTNEIFFIELVETLDDLIFVINTPDMSLFALDAILKTMKEKFPHIYDSLDSLLFVKKGFNNK